jgi:hypothetical protein
VAHSHNGHHTDTGTENMATHLTKKFIASREPPQKGYRIWYDDEVKGFGVRTTANGAKTFVLN